MNQEKSKEIKALLQRLGLDEKESRAYLYCLAHGPQHVSAIGRACGFTRPNAYDVVNKLEAKGLCYNLGALYGRKIKVNPPASLKEMLVHKQTELHVLEQELEKSLPLFRDVEVYKPAVPSEVSYFRGKEGMEQLISMSLRSKSLLRCAGSEIDVIEAFGEEYLVNYHQSRVRRKVMLHALRPGSRRGKHAVFQSDPQHLRITRISKEGIKLKSVVYLWDDYVAFCSFTDEMFGTLIKNQRLQAMLASWFDLIWESSSAA